MLPKYSLRSLVFALWGGFVLLSFSVSAIAAESVNETVRHRFEAQLSGFGIRAGGQPLLAGEPLLQFYEDRQFELAWFEAGRLRPEALDLLRTIDRSAGEGLQPSDYHQDAISTLISELSATATAAEQIDLDLLLSDAFLVLGAHLLSGKLDPLTQTAVWTAKRPGLDMASLLDQALEAGSVEAMLDTLRPSQPGYQQLREKRKRIVELAARGAWTPLEPGGLIRPGEKDRRLPAIRHRLVELGDHPEVPLPDSAAEGGSLSEVYDIELLAATSRFQARHGLQPDGVIGPDTVAALNIPPEQRRRQIDINLERWRWLPEQLGSLHIMVNIAGSELKVVADRQSLRRHSLAVGQACQDTPVFSDEIRYFVFNPNWIVPRRLLNSVSSWRALEPGSLETLGFVAYEGWGTERAKAQVADLDISQLTNDPALRLVQNPGPHNLLGKAKIMFPNEHDFYLHGKPSADPFSHSETGFPAGCVRVEAPLDLADLLLGKEQGWSRRFVRNGGSTTDESRAVYLNEPVKVHVQYLTAWADEDGLVQVREDLFGRDAAVAEGLASSPGQR